MPRSVGARSTMGGPEARSEDVAIGPGGLDLCEASFGAAKTICLGKGSILIIKTSAGRR